MSVSPSALFHQEKNYLVWVRSALGSSGLEDPSCLKNDKSSIVEKSKVLEFQIFSKIQGAHKEFMIVPRLLGMHRALKLGASAPNKRISEMWGEVDFQLSNASQGKL